MSEISRQDIPEENNLKTSQFTPLYSSPYSEVYAKLNAQDVEQFYAGYELWKVQQRIATLQAQIAHLHQQIAENTERMQQLAPSAVALASLARLQANGVQDSDLLNRMLERGEEWLDHTMQRLDYCEQLGFIRSDYIQWCEHALEGAYDWIDSLRESIDADAAVSSGPQIATGDFDAIATETTEELLLRKLTSDEEGEPLSTIEAKEIDSSIFGAEVVNEQPQKVTLHQRRYNFSQGLLLVIVVILIVLIGWKKRS